jgi:Cof subfamily protein (haloacid dehalogenase superfamily)
MENIKAIFIDLDGTLVGHDGIVHEDSINVLNELKNRGIKIVISTGRNYHQARKIAGEIEGVYYITNNGAYVVDDKGEVISSRELNNRKLLDLIDEILQFKKMYFFVQNHEIIVTNSTLWDRYRNAFASTSLLKLFSLDNLKAFFHRETTIGTKIKYLEMPRDYFITNENKWLKILVTGNKKGIDYLADKYKKAFNISFSHSSNIEINEFGVSKGQAIKEFCELHKINLKDTMCFGDSGNDIEMFKAVGIPVVMANSEVKELHKISKFKADHYDNQGVAKFLKEKFDIK